MALIGIDLDRKNPEFHIDDFFFWSPQFTGVEWVRLNFNKLKNIANQKIFYSIWGTDWEYAMSLCISHYIELIAQNKRIPQTSDLTRLGGGGSYKGVMSSMTIGAFSKSLELDKTMLTNEESFFWNQTSYGASLMALYKTKAIPTIFVVTQDE